MNFRISTIPIVDVNQLHAGDLISIKFHNCIFVILSMHLLHEIKNLLNFHNPLPRTESFLFPNEKKTGHLKKNLVFFE